MVGVHDRPRQLLIRTEREDGDRVRVTVRDAGVGVEPQSMDKLFDAFYTTKSDGMGIGLFVSRSIIERHQGRLWAEPNDAAWRHVLVFHSPRSQGLMGTRASDPALRDAGDPSQCDAPRQRLSVAARDLRTRWQRSLVSVVDDDESCASRCPTCCGSSALPPRLLVGRSVPRVRVVERDELSDPRRRDARHVRPRSSAGTDTSAAEDSDCLHHRHETDAPSAPARGGAVECLFKPFSETALLDALNAALRTR